MPALLCPSPGNSQTPAPTGLMSAAISTSIRYGLFAAMARSCGVEGVRVDRAGDLGEAIRKGIAANKPYLIDVDIAADINPVGAGVWELPGLGQSKAGIGTRYQPA